MPADPFEQLGGMAVAGGIVAGFAVPVGLAMALLNRRLGGSLAPQWRAYPSRFNGVEILLIFGIYHLSMLVGPGLLDSLGFFEAIYGTEIPTTDKFRVIRHLWVSLFVTPMLLAGSLAVPWFLRYQAFKFEPKQLPGRIAIAVLAWLVATPAVLGIYYLTLLLVQNFGGPQQEHPLAETGPGEALFDQVFFGFVVCVITPLAEEILFRGLLVRWAAGRWFRPWILVVVAAMFLVSTMSPQRLDYGPLALAAFFGLGLYGIQRLGHYRPGFAERTASAVFSSAAFFGAVHVSVWPTPVPLFFLGLVLGYIASRSGSIVGPVVFHGLFNAVSFVYLLRNGST